MARRRRRRRAVEENFEHKEIQNLINFVTCQMIYLVFWFANENVEKTNKIIL